MLRTLFLSFPIFAFMHLPHFYAPTALLYTLTAVLDFYRAFIHPDRGSRLQPHFYAPTALLYTLTTVLVLPRFYTPTAFYTLTALLYAYRT